MTDFIQKTFVMDTGERYCLLIDSQSDLPFSVFIAAEGQTPTVLNDKDTLMLLTLQNTISDFHQCEIQNAEKKALRNSLFFCLGILTIPFVKLFYNHQRNKYAEKHFFQTLHIEPGLLSAQPSEKDKNKLSFMVL